VHGGELREAIAQGGRRRGDLEVELNRERLLHYVLWRWLEVGRGRALVTTQKEFVEWLSERLPDEISVRHFNDLSGLDDYSGVRLLISIGRCAPPPLQMEAEAGALSGRAPETVTGPGYWWYPRRDHELQPGMIVKYCPYHPDQLVEAARWQPWEGLVVHPVGKSYCLPTRSTVISSARTSMPRLPCSARPGIGLKLPSRRRTATPVHYAVDAPFLQSARSVRRGMRPSGPWTH
jgi:hypothetical protein